MRVRTAIASTLLAALAGCAGCDDVPADALEDCEASQVAPGAVKTDILFVIDDSVSMGDEQTLLQNGLAAFIQSLAGAPIANDFRIGVTTTSVAQFDGTPAPPAGEFVDPFLAATTANLVSLFQAQVAVGTGGSAREQPFEAARLALEKSTALGSLNEGFLRPGARLAIIFLSDEDDCSGPQDGSILDSGDCRAAKADPGSSLEAVADLASYLGGPIAGEARTVIVAAIVGVDPATLAPSCGEPYCANQGCSTAFDQGDRFVELLGRMSPTQTRLASICDATFDHALQDFAMAIMSHTLPLDGAVADHRMLVASVTKPGAGAVACTIAHESDPAPQRYAAGAVYRPPLAGAPASLTFQNDCALEAGDRVDVGIVCAR